MPSSSEAAFRYLMFALLGSALYLLGAGLMLGVHGTLDIAQIRAALVPARMQARRRRRRSAGPRSRRWR
jgi:NADH:ubiquinone oxidoreductase subunit 2 (subunit N)